MLSMATTGVHVHQAIFPVSLRHFDKSKKYKERLLKEIIITICGMMNSHGGKILMNIHADSDVSASQRSSVLRAVEQQLISIIGTNITAGVHFENYEDKEKITIFVEKGRSLITTNYHLYLPSQTQVVLFQPSESQERVKNDILNRNSIDQQVQLESHQKIFLEGKESGLTESKTVQLKNVKADASNCTKLADRMTGKSNKFNCYVSAFANYKGGHIYYGIDDEGMVKGELVEKKEDKNEITKKVEKSIKKMIWPEQPKRKVHWEIFFEPVLDRNSAPIPSTFVIVIYIAPCLGGVFTESPECYEMVTEKVEKMSFITWKERISQPVQLFHPPINDSALKCRSPGSSRIQKICSHADELLMATLNEGKSINKIANNLVKRNPDLVELQLLILAKKVMANYRSCTFEAARKVLAEYKISLKKATEFWMFDAIHLYLETAIYFAQENVEAVDNILPEVLDRAEKIKRGRISAAIYLLAAKYCLQQQGDSDNSPVKLSNRALEDLKHVKDLPKVQADMEHKCHILLALFYLGCDGFRMPSKKVIDFEKANRSMDIVNQSIEDGHLMTPYRELQFGLVKSIVYYRKSQMKPQRVVFLKAAFNASKKTEAPAVKCNFQDLVDWSRNCMGLFAENLIRSTMQSITRSR